MTKTKKTPEDKTAEERAQKEAAEAQRIGREKRADEVLGAFSAATRAYEQHGPFRNLRRAQETAVALTSKFARVTAEVTYTAGQGTSLVVRAADVAIKAQDIIDGRTHTLADCVNDPVEVLGFVRAYDLLADDIAGLRRKVADAEREREALLEACARQRVVGPMAGMLGPFGFF